jgi:hypothetical protein
MTLMVRNSSWGRVNAGVVNVWMVVSIALIVITVATSTASIWAMLHYFDEKQTVDTQVDNAVAKAQKDQADTDADKFAQQEKQPNREFVGPDEYGRLAFDYPKTWSAYIAQNSTSNGQTYQAYFNPISVPPITLSSQQFALRVTIEQKDYDTVINSYSSLVKKGDLKTSSVTVNGVASTELTGNFTKDIRGAAVIIRILDKTVIIQTDADTFMNDFNALISTVTFKS